MTKKKVEDYQPYNGFYDLRDFDIPKKEFLKLWNLQQFLYQAEEQRKRGYKHPQIQGIKDLSAQYQQILFSYPEKNVSKG